VEGKMIKKQKIVYSCKCDFNEEIRKINLLGFCKDAFVLARNDKTMVGNPFAYLKQIEAQKICKYAKKIRL